MTALSTLPGAMSAGLNAFSSPLGSSAPLLMQLLKGAGGGMPGSLAPQIPMLPGAPRGAAGPVPPVGPAPQPPQSNLLSSLGPLSGILGKSLGGGNSASAPQGLFGSNGLLFGYNGLFGTNGWLANLNAATLPQTDAAITNGMLTSGFSPEAVASGNLYGDITSLGGMGAAAGAAGTAVGASAAAPALAGGVGDIGTLLASNPEFFAMFA